MGRSDDSISRRRNKQSRKKQENKKDSSAKVSARVAAIIAFKNRRKSGKRRQCQGMCFSLPTPEDPFNDKHGKIDHTKKRKRSSKANEKPWEKKARMLEKVTQCGGDSHVDPQEHEVGSGHSESVEPFSFMGPEIAINVGKPTCQVINRNKPDRARKENCSENKTERPSKFLITCLNSIQTALEHVEGYVSEGDKPFFANAWGTEFWNFYSNRKDVLETDRADSTMEQIAWIASTAADTISMKEKEGLSFTSPFLLYLVPSREKASKVREVCKPLKPLGIHTVSLHSGASIDHQVNGLKSCEPEFIVSTPERLLELLTLKAFDTFGVSLLDKTAAQLIKHLKRLQNERTAVVDRIRSDKRTEFLNQLLSSYFENHGIKHDLSAARSPQQNGVAERINHTLKEAARTMSGSPVLQGDVSRVEDLLPQRNWWHGIKNTNAVLAFPELQTS